MKLRNKVAALMGAGILAMGIAGTALADTGLLAGQVGNTLGSYSNVCDNFSADDGGIWVQFNLTSAASTSGNLSATFSNPSFTVTDQSNAFPNGTSDGKTDKWYVFVTGATLDTVIESASVDIDGNNLVISHICTTDETTTTTSSSSTSFTSSESGSSTTETTSSTTSFTGSQSGETSVPSQPNTATIGDGSSGPSNGAWLLVAALGALVGSIVVLTPAKAKNRR